MPDKNYDIDLKHEDSHSVDHENDHITELFNSAYDAKDFSTAKPKADSLPPSSFDSDTLKKILDFLKEPGDKQADKALPLSDSTIEEYAKSITKIIGKNDDFSYGGKNEKIRDMFIDAAKAGKESFDKLLNAVNKDLAEKGLSIKGSFSISKASDVVDYGGIMQTSYPPIYPNAKVRYTETAAINLSLSSKAAGEEDTLKFNRTIADYTVRESYSPPSNRKIPGQLLEPFRFEPADDPKSYDSSHDPRGYDVRRMR